MQKLASKFKSYHFIIFVISLYITLFYHYTFWNTLLETTKDFENLALLFLSIGILLCCFLALCFELLGFFGTYRLVLLFFVMLSAICAYYMDSYKISFNPMIIDSILHTNLREAQDFIHLKMIAKIVLMLLFPLGIIFFIHPKKPCFKTKWILLASYIFIILSIVFFNGRSIVFAFKAYKPTIDMLNPIAPIRSTIRHISTTLQTPKAYTFVGSDATLKHNDKPKIIVLVIGESARAKNFQYNGYQKPTNPYTKIYKNELINFSNFSSCGVITAISIPCMLTNLTHQTYTSRNLSYYQDNILDIAKRSNYNVWWISNNGGECMGKVCQRLDHITYYDNGALDGDMLKQIATLISEAKNNTLLAINLHGSHGAKYFERYPKDFLYFKPVCTDENLQNCDQETLLNAYDNSLRYTDYFLAQVISYLKKSPLANLLWYVSDHGESLGEYGQYMHGGLPYSLSPKEQTHIPSFIFLGQGYENYYDTLNSIKKLPLNHDFVFHTLLDFLNIDTKDYNPKLDLLKQKAK